MGWLEGKVALLVGAGSGIGRAVLEAFLAEGARVAVLEVDPEKCARLQEYGDRVVAVAGDATVLEDNRRAVQEAVRAFGGLDVLVNFVGVFDFYTRLEEIPEDRLEEAVAEVFRTNVLTHLLSVKAALPELRRRPGSSVILTVSTSGFYPGRGVCCTWPPSSRCGGWWSSWPTSSRPRSG